MTEVETARLRRRELDEAMARVREQIPPPKMVIVRQGWFREKVRRLSADEWEQEDRERAARG